ncbi:MAG: ParB N-terminal domain-containing protein [Desulfurococcaceae archaeon TW002]
MIKHYVTEAQLVELDKLKEHEEVNSIRLEELKKEIKTDTILKFAIVVDKNTNIIFDGGLWFNALKELGCKRIPVIYVDYNSPDIEVFS